jgi:nucleoside 2-deoxyribosyltransferase
MKIYLAGPDVFLPDARAVGQLKREICKRHGLEGLFPLDGAPPETSNDEPLSLRIFKANTALMEQANAIIANLTPFRGPSADAGTVYELGYMLGLAARDKTKLCLAYSNVSRSYLDKVRDQTAIKRDSKDVQRDADDLEVEDFGLSDNLMIIHGLEMSGHSLVTPDRPVADPLRDLTAFEVCVRIAAEYLSRYPD